MVTQGAYGPPGSELQRLYDADAVDRYVAQLHAHIEDLQRQVAEAVRLAHEAETKTMSAANAEAMLGRVMMTAQKAADDALADAQRRAELLLSQARAEADRMLGDVRADAQRIVDEAHETVEAVFAAISSVRDREPQAPPAAGPAAVPSAPPAAFAGAPAPTSAFAPPPPGPSWPAPDPAQRHVEAEPEPLDEPHPAATALAVAEDHDDDDDGMIVDLRPVRGHPSPQARNASPAGAGDGGWSASLGGTGTEGWPLREPDPEWIETEWTETEWTDTPWTETQWTEGPSDAAPRGSSDLLDRWRLATGGPAASDDTFVSRQAAMDSLADGSWVAHLRGEDPPASRAAGFDPWQPKPPPVGPPVWPESRRGLLSRRHR